MKHTIKKLSVWLLTAVLLSIMIPTAVLPAAAAEPERYYAAAYDFHADPRTRISDVVEMTDPDGDGTYEAVFDTIAEATGGWYGFCRCDAAGNMLPEALAQCIPSQYAQPVSYIFSYNPTTGAERAVTEVKPHIYIGETVLADGDYLATGADTITATKPTSGGYAHYADDVLTLHDFTLIGDTGIGSDDLLTVVLEGTNVINVTIDDGLENDATTTIKGTGSLSITTLESDGIDIDDGDLIIESGTLNIAVLQSEPDYTADGIDMTDGNIYINGGKITIVATDHGIESDNSIEDDEHFFGVYINDGTLDITAENEGIDAEDYLEINGGTITIHDADIGLDCGGDALITGGHHRYYLAR